MNIYKRQNHGHQAERDAMKKIESEGLSHTTRRAKICVIQHWKALYLTKHMQIGVLPMYTNMISEAKWPV